MQLGIAHHSPHALRHGCANHLINTGICLNEVRDHLGQLSMDAARIYAKVNLLSAFVKYLNLIYQQENTNPIFKKKKTTRIFWRIVKLISCNHFRSQRKMN